MKHDLDPRDMVEMEVADIMAKAHALDKRDEFYKVAAWPAFIRHSVPGPDVGWVRRPNHWERFTVLNFLCGNGAPYDYVKFACVRQNPGGERSWEPELEDVWGQWQRVRHWTDEEWRQHAYYDMERRAIVYIRQGRWWRKMPDGRDVVYVERQN